MKIDYLDGKKTKHKTTTHILKYLKWFTANYNAPSGEKKKKRKETMAQST